MQHLVLSTDNIPQRERFSYWREAVAGIGIPGERDRAPETGFDGRLAVTSGGNLTRFRFSSSKYRVCRRLRQLTRHDGADRIWLYRDIGGGSWHDDNGRQFVTRPGEVIIGDPALPLATEALDHYDHEIWHFPRTLLDPHLPAAQHPHMLRLSGRGGTNGIVLSYLEALSGTLDSLDDTEATRIADNFCRLLAVVCGSGAGEHQDAIRDARLAEAKSYVRLHLADHDLTPETAAGALKMSVRQLHIIFEPTGTSFARYVLQLRLEECRAALMNPAGERSVTDIALAWGFNSLSTFYRAFRQAFGTTPTELRARSQ
jgi:AraC-like DNA-binding protein